MIEFLLATWLNVADRWTEYRLSPLQNEWFSRMKPPKGSVPCCSTADGIPAQGWERRLDYTAMEEHYWVKVDEKWLQVPDEAVILNSGNPVGVPVVWFYSGGSGIRCFVPGPEN